MARRNWLVVAVAALSAGALGQVPLRNDELETLRRDQAVAEQQLDRLQAIARKTKDDAQRVAAERRAAAAGIEAAELRISAAAELAAREGERLAALERALAEAKRPMTSLLAGLAMMGERPPIVAFADRGDIDELVRARILIGATMPVVRKRSAALAERIRSVDAQRAAAGRAQRQLRQDRRLLTKRKTRLAAIEDRMTAAAMRAGSAAIIASDRVLAGRETLERRPSATARAIAAELLAEDPVPVFDRAPPDTGLPAIHYVLPADASVTRGFGEVEGSGIRARSLTLASARGLPVVAPASGIIRFAGPFETYDGIVIIDHGKGWLTVLTNVETPARVGAWVRVGERFARTLGPIGVELSHNGRFVSPALIAGSSTALFKGR